MGILAAAQAGAAAGGSFSMIIVFIALIAVMYFMMIRPQNKEKKRMQAMLSAMEVGDAVVTTAGFYGIIVDITEQDVIVEFGNNRNCRIPMRKEAIVQVEKAKDAIAKAKEPAPSDNKKTDKKDSAKAVEKKDKKSKEAKEEKK